MDGESHTVYNISVRARVPATTPIPRRYNTTFFARVNYRAIMAAAAAAAAACIRQPSARAHVWCLAFSEIEKKKKKTRLHIITSIVIVIVLTGASSLVHETQLNACRLK